MAEPHLDAPGEVTWYPNQGPLPVLGPCPHLDCEHNLASVIAWGPDHEHYTLSRCDDQCGGECRSWTVEYPSPFTRERPKFRFRGFLHTQAEASNPEVDSG